jgi:hypothetical protein
LRRPASSPLYSPYGRRGTNDRLLCGLQSGRTSAPTRPHLVQAMRAPSDDAIPLHQAEAEVERLRGIVRSQEYALRVAGKVLAPYAARAGIGR